MNSEEKKLVGKWNDWSSSGSSSRYEFKKDGTFIRLADIRIGFSRVQYQSHGYYSLKNGELTLQLQSRRSFKSEDEYFWNLIPWEKWETVKYPAKLYTNEDGKQILEAPGKYYKVNN